MNLNVSYNRPTIDHSGSSAGIVLEQNNINKISHLVTSNRT